MSQDKQPVLLPLSDCITAIRSVQAAYDAKYGPGPSIEASVCSDCIGALNTLAAAPQPAQAEHQPLTREHMNALHRAWVELEGNDADLMKAVMLASAKAWGVKLAGGPADA